MNCSCIDRLVWEIRISANKTYHARERFSLINAEVSLFTPLENIRYQNQFWITQHITYYLILAVMFTISSWRTWTLNVKIASLQRVNTQAVLEPPFPDTHMAYSFPSLDSLLPWSMQWKQHLPGTLAPLPCILSLLSLLTKCHITYLYK